MRRATALAAPMLALLALAVPTPEGAGTAAASPTVFPTGVTIHDKAAAYDCDLLFSSPDRKTRLIDMSGRVLKTWDREGSPPKMVDPALVRGRKGVVGLQLEDVNPADMKDAAEAVGINPFDKAMHANETFGLVDWNGKTLWSWSGPASVHAALQHHDWARLPDGDMLILSDEARRLPRFGDREMIDDVVYEVGPAGEVVWSWSAADHLDELGFTPSELALVERSPQADYLHVNSMSVLGPNRWEKAGDSRFAPGNIMISSRNANVTLIIDRATGHVVWRIGPDYPRRDPLEPEVTPRPVDQISGQHDPHMIPEGLPGAGDILMYDNEGEAGYPPVALQLLGGSRVLEIDPTTKEIVWEYVGANSGQVDFMVFSPFLGSVQRLPNGNTLIDEGIDGRLFQVTAKGKLVWEYVSPFVGPAPQPPAPGQAEPVASNWVYRVQGVPLGWLP